MDVDRKAGVFCVSNVLHAAARDVRRTLRPSSEPTGGAPGFRALPLCGPQSAAFTGAPSWHVGERRSSRACLPEDLAPRCCPALAIAVMIK